jgi:hypothetical protein
VFYVLYGLTEDESKIVEGVIFFEIEIADQQARPYCEWAVIEL